MRIEQIWSTIGTAKGRLKSLVRRERLVYRWRLERSVGIYGTAYVGDRFTVVKDPKQELGPGLLSDMCNRLGIRKEDL